MVNAEREPGGIDIYDAGYGESEDDLRPLERGAMSLRMGSEDGDGNDRYPYSRINALQAEIKFRALYDFIKDYLPKSHKTKVLVNDLVRLCENMLNAEANRRQLRFDLEDTRGKYWVNRAGKDGSEHIEQADRLLDRWGNADLLQILIRRQRITDGLAAVEHERSRWYTAARKKALIERMSARLPQAAYQYFNSRKEQYTIMRELAEDRAKGIPIQDFSHLITRIQEGKATEAEIIMDAPWPFFEAFNVCVQDADIDNPHWGHIRQLQASAARAQASRRRNRWSSREEEGGSDDAQ